MVSTTEQMESMLPSNDTDYYNTPEQDFTASDFASDTWEQARKRFMDAGITNTDPNDPKLITAYNRSMDYFKDVGLSGLLATQAAYEFAVGSIADSVPFASEGNKKRLAKDLAAMPEAFVGGGTRSLSQLDDLAELAAPAAKQTIAKTVDLADRVYIDPTKTGAIAGSFSLRTPLETGNFKRARELFKKFDGSDPRNFNSTNTKVFNETGWYINPSDNQWRFEINDKPAKIDFKNFQGKELLNQRQITGSELFDEIQTLADNKSIDVSLTDFFKHEKLYRRYPHLKRMRVTFSADSGANASLGSFTSGQNLITINPAKVDLKDKRFKEILMHEIQHSIQEYEGFIPGANSSRIPFEVTEKHAKTLTSELVNARITRQELLNELDDVSLGEGYNTGPFFKLLSRDENLKPGVTLFASEESVVDKFAQAAKESGLPDNIFDLYPKEKGGVGGSPQLIQLGNILNLLRGSHLDDVYHREAIENINEQLYRGTFGELEANVVGKSANMTPTERGLDPVNMEKVIATNQKVPEDFVGSYDATAGRAVSGKQPGFQRRKRSRIPELGVVDAKIDINFDGVYNSLDITNKSFNEMSAVQRAAAYSKFLLDNIIKDNKELKKIKNLKRGDTFSYTLDNGDVVQARFQKALMAKYDRQNVEKGEGQIILKDTDPSTYEDGTSFKVPEILIELVGDGSIPAKTQLTISMPELIKNSDLVKDGKNFDIMDLQEKLPSVQEEGAVNKIKNLFGFAEGGAMMRPEPRPDSIDVSPRAEAGDQFFVEQAEREKAFKTKPVPRPSMDKSFPNVKPEPRPEGRSEFITRGYEVDGREIQVGIIKFKGGEEIAFDKVLQNIDAKGTANEPVVTKNTMLQVINFLKENNPTREEFETYWYNKRLNKGGAMMDKQMQMAFMDEGGLTDDGMDVDPVSGNDIPSGSMAEEVRDDIPAQLSDGEYVVPADVVRYYGVKFFEDLRERAKMGLQEMEMNGRIGGEPVPAGGPINTEELSPEEMQAIQEMMGMSQGGSVNAYKAQQELLEQPPAKAVGNPVMMSGGGQVRGYQDSSLVTSNLTEQNMLDVGNKASNDPYIGEDLGFSIFGPSNNQQGVQQTEVKPFTSVTLYNKSGQTRVANNAEEKAKAIADGYTMTLSEYNMYKSKTVGGGSGGGGIIPPGEDEDGEVKPWAQDLGNWNSVSDIEQFVAQAERGNLSGSGRFLRGAGFAIAGLPGAALATAFQTGKGLSSLYDMKAAQIIAEAKGKAGSEEHADLANKIQDGINTYLKDAGGDIINFFYNSKIGQDAINKRVSSVYGKGYENVDDWAAGTKRTTVSDFAASTTRSGKGAKASQNILDKRKGSGMGPSKVTSKTFPSAGGSTRVYTSGAKEVKAGTATADEVKTMKDKIVSSGGTYNVGGRNKGGLMTKGKKK